MLFENAESKTYGVNCPVNLFWAKEASSRRFCADNLSFLSHLIPTKHKPSVQQKCKNKQNTNTNMREQKERRAVASFALITSLSHPNLPADTKAEKFMDR